MTRQSRLGRLGAAALILVTSVALGACSPASSGGGAPESRVRQPSFFYRMQADFILKETGEPIQFDYVVACGGVVENYSYTSPTVFYTHHPIIMFEPVGDGQALGLVTIDMCDDWKWQPLKFGPMAGQSRIPETLRPRVIWFDDINDLSKGWGYETDDAYTSPRAKIEFVKASVSSADKNDWNTWRKETANSYQEIGALPGPWGYNYSEESSEALARTYSRGNGLGIAHWSCSAVLRVSVPPELVKDIFDQFPEYSGRYMFLTGDHKPTPEQIERLYGRHGLMDGGRSFRDFYRAEKDSGGSLCRNGYCHILPYSIYPDDQKGLAFRDVYPSLPRSFVMGDVKTPQDTYYQEIVIDDAHKGFSACSSHGRAIDRLQNGLRLRGWDPKNNRDPLDPSGLDKRHVLIVGDDRVMNLPHSVMMTQGPGRILDREGYFFF